MESDIKQLRLSSCIQTILEVHDSICQKQINAELTKRFETLERSLNSLEGNWISEADVVRVEETTNLLLGELQGAFRQNPSCIHPGPRH